MMSHPVVTAAPLLSNFDLRPRDLQFYFDLHTTGPVPRADLDQAGRSSFRRLRLRGLVHQTDKKEAIITPIADVYWEQSLRRPKRVERVQSPYQVIELYELDGGHFLTLNGMVQYSSTELKESHELMVGVPLCLAKQARSVLILGGGDGYAAAEALRCPSVEKIRVVELDPEMVRLHREHPTLSRLNEGAFSHPKVEVIVGDALGHLLELREEFDVIVDDCEFQITKQDQAMIARRQAYFDHLPRALAPGGVGSLMQPVTADFPEEASAVREELEARDPRLLGAWPEDLRTYIKEVSQALFPHCAHAELRCSYLGVEMYNYFSQDPLSDVQREPHSGNACLNRVLQELTKESPQ